MNDQRQRISNPFRLKKIHEKNVLLLEAYAAHELEHGEKEVVEQHLVVCRECQHLLAIIQQSRERFSRLRIDEDSRETAIALNRQHLLQLTDKVMYEIVKRGGETMKQESVLERLLFSASTNMLHRKKNLSPLLPIAATLCIVVVVSLFLATLRYSHQPATGQPPRLAWETQQGQLIAQSAGATFSIKYITLTPHEFRFFYVFHTPQPTIPHVEAFSYLPSTPGATISIAATVQSLGQLGAFNVGVVYVHPLYRVGQIIQLQITSSGSSTSSTLRLDPLKQLYNHASANYSFSVSQAVFPEIIWYGPVTIEQVAFFKIVETHQSGAGPSHIFVRLDDPITVRTITQAEYIAIAGQQNFF